jgi:hypothetical protein
MKMGSDWPLMAIIRLFSFRRESGHKGSLVEFTERLRGSHFCESHFNRVAALELDQSVMLAERERMLLSETQTPTAQLCLRP